MKIVQDAGMIRTLVLGCAVASLAFLGQTDILSRVSGAFNDRDVMVRWSSVLSGATREAIPVTVIDIDDATLARVNGVDRTPRDLAAGLVALAADRRAAAIVLDLDTSRAGPDPAADRALTDAVASYPSAAPMLMYARRFVGAAPQQPATEFGLVPLPSILDGPAAGRSNVLAISSVAPLDNDRVIRRWRLSQTICNNDGAMSYASPQLVALALRETPDPRKALDEFLGWRNADQCAAGSPRPAWPRNPDMNASLWFLFGSAPGDAPITMVEYEGRRTSVVRHIPAHTLLRSDGRVAPSTSVSAEIFAGRVVVIGSSHLDSFDTHVTPLGPMPGAFIVANAIAGAPATLSAAYIPAFVRTLIAMAIFAALVTITRPLRAMAAGIVVITIMLVLLALLGRVLAPSTALTICLLSTALLALFSGLSSLYEIAEAWRRVGWRALLKNPPPATDAKPNEAALAGAGKESQTQ